ncbi:MAG: UvrD-helicase domain-containing protein [Oscillospiraceae bacterium]|nr:UvrD-helicase domain-containing protein [Oscillospiraceae bacterium]
MPDIVLTPQQRLAVENRGGALLVSAAAGSGKTRVLVDRVLGRLCDPDEPRNINDFLIITYTKAAAQELRGKIASAISEALSAQPENRHLARQLSRIYLAQISTVHAFCANALRDYAHELGIYPDFRIAEEVESVQWQQQALEQTLTDAYASLEEDPDCRAFLDQLGAGRDDRACARILLQAYGSVQCHPDPRGWINECLQALELGQCTDMAETCWGDKLLREFRRTLDEQIRSMERGLARLSELAAAEAKYGPTYQKNIEQLRQLRQADSWDALYQGRITDFGKLSAVFGLDKDTLERLKRPRQQCMDVIKREQLRFSMPSGEALEELRAGAPVIRGMFRLLGGFMARYQAVKQQHRALDFGDLEHEMLRLLYRSDGSLSAAAWELRDKYCEVMVDEYQDSNRVQDRIFQAVSRDGENLFMVGDVKQSIYRFRLADPGIFIEKYRDFGDAETAQGNDARRVLLSHNFRSRPQILSAVNDIFSLCMSEWVGDIEYGEAEKLRSGIDPAPVEGPCVELHCLDTEEREEGDSKDALEARLVAGRIDALLKDRYPVRDGASLRPVEPGDIVILLRSMRSHAQAYLRALHERGIEAVSDQSDDIL